MNSHKQSALNFLTMITAGDIDAAYETYADMHGTHHNMFTLSGFIALRDGMKGAHVQFPHMTLTVKHVLEDGDLVAVHSHLVLEEDKLGMAVVHMLRFKDGKISEIWDIASEIPSEPLNKDGAF